MIKTHENFMLTDINQLRWKNDEWIYYCDKNFIIKCKFSSRLEIFLQFYLKAFRLLQNYDILQVLLEIKRESSESKERRRRKSLITAHSKHIIMMLLFMTFLFLWMELCVLCISCPKKKLLCFCFRARNEQKGEEL